MKKRNGNEQYQGEEAYLDGKFDMMSFDGQGASINVEMNMCS
jgi:hypothetical protein